MKKLLVSVLLSVVPTAFSQSYSGTVNDLNTIFNPPANIQGIICQHTDSDNTQHTGVACRDGVAAARWMAEKYAKRAGKYLGCIDGYYQGIWDGYSAGVNPTAEMIKEAEAYVAQSTMNTAVRRAKVHAGNTATTESADQIIRRYREVINQADNGNQVLPDKTPNMPPITFDGFDDGYESDIANGTVQGGDFQDALREGYITANSPFNDKIAARKSYYLQGQHARSLCDVTSTIFGRRGLPQLTIWDYFRARRTRNFQKYGWKNGSWAWDVYNTDEANLDLYQNYQGLKNKTITETVARYKWVNKLDENGQVIPVLNPDGTPKLNPDGSPVYEQEKVFSHNETVTRKVNTDELKVLQRNYQDAFKNSYNLYFAKQYASQEYHQEGLEKYEASKILGRFIGEDVAENTARKNAYDSRYKLVSAQKYAEEAEKIYLASFRRLINIFENNPVVEINDARVIGNMNDGIYRPGEALSVALSVTNLGEVARPVTMRVKDSVDVVANQMGHQFTPASLQRTSTETGIIGSISNDTQARQRINVNMILDNPSNLNEVSSELIVSKLEGLLVREYVEVKSTSPTLDFLQGKITATVVLENPSSVETPAFPMVRLSNTITNTSVEKNVLKIGGGNTQEVVLTLTDLDPMTIIAKGGIAVRAESILSNKITHKQDNSVSLGLSSDDAFSKYFSAIVTNQTSNTGSDSKSVRVGKLISEFETSLDADLANGNIRWNKRNLNKIAATIVGSLQRSYQEAKSSRKLTNQAKEEYNKVAELLAKKVNNGGKNRVRGKKKYFLQQLKKFAPKLSTKPKHHK